MTENTSPLSVADELARAEAELAAWQERVAALKMRKQEEAAQTASISEESQTLTMPEAPEVTESCEAKSCGPIGAPLAPPAPETIQETVPEPASFSPSFSSSGSSSPVQPIAESQPILTEQSPMSQSSVVSQGDAIPQSGVTASEQTPPAAYYAGTYETQYASVSQEYSYAQQSYAPAYGKAKDHVAAGLLAILFGWLGVHKFYMGYNTAGFIMLGISVIGGIFTFTLAFWVIEVIAIIEGILYLVKSQSEFEQIYMFNKREWF